MDDITQDDTENDNLSFTEQMAERLSWLRSEHRRIDQEIDALLQGDIKDMLKIRRMKKLKLSMKDQEASRLMDSEKS